ncbi:MAG: peptidase M23 [Betaproteobacteria bacterium HGW-Betaproteobacteria-22]|nr:MAG: peptidase M23 [Betaproteobacteria bacterium HGW-Betaproteobacteria-22]
MDIILVSNNMAKAKTLSALQISLIVLGLVALPAILIFMLILPQESSAQKGVVSLIPGHLRFSFNNPQKHLDAYALQLGELQARMMRLDAQSERLAKLAGDKSKPPVPSAKGQITDEQKVSTGSVLPSTSNKTGAEQENAKLKPGQGGPLVREAPLSEFELQSRIADLVARIEYKTEHLSEIEAKLLQQSVLKNALPNSSPVQAAFNSSSFGWRLDPFNGHKAFHEGLDFTAETGTPIYAAAGGIVTAAVQTPDYGKIIKIDHGSGLETRYAHASKLLVNTGERVKKGQKIAEVGSTGRSTGPHLHYEIRLNGNPLDPRKYLSASN